MARSRSPCRKAGSGRRKPALPTTGSRMMAATGCEARSASTAARSLNCATSVLRVAAAGTPGLSGRPSVATPEPACTRKLSAWPW